MTELSDRNSDRIDQIVIEFPDLPEDVIEIAKRTALQVANADTGQLNMYISDIDSAADPNSYDHPDVRIRLRSNFAKFLIDSNKSLLSKKKAIWSEGKLQDLDLERKEIIVLRRIRPAITGRLFALRYAERYGYERDDSGNIIPTGTFISAHELSLRILQNIT